MERTEFKTFAWAAATAALAAAFGCDNTVEQATPDFLVDRAPPEDTYERPVSETAEPLNPLVRRLTRSEYANTINDTLGLTLSDEELNRLPLERASLGLRELR